VDPGVVQKPIDVGLVGPPRHRTLLHLNELVLGELLQAQRDHVLAQAYFTGERFFLGPGLALLSGVLPETRVNQFGRGIDLFSDHQPIRDD
jgi:hypothetical protein